MLFLVKIELYLYNKKGWKPEKDIVHRLVEAEDKIDVMNKLKKFYLDESRYSMWDYNPVFLDITGVIR